MEGCLDVGRWETARRKFLADPHRALPPRRMGTHEGLKAASVIEEPLFLQSGDRLGCSLGRIALHGELVDELGGAEIAAREQPQCITPRGLRILRLFRRGVTKASA